MTQSVSETIKADVIDYMGKFEGGIMSMLDIVYNDKHYSGTFFYTEDTIALTVDDELEEEWGYVIEDHIEYKRVVFDLLKRVVPHKELINSIDDVDLTNYIKQDS
jgi:hypothetical protein